MNFKVKLITKNKAPLPLELSITDEGLIWRVPNGNSSRIDSRRLTLTLVPTCDILAIHHVTSGFKHPDNTDLYQIHYVQHLHRKLLKMTSIVIGVDKSEANVCTNTLISMIDGNKIPKRLLVFINPISGKRLGTCIYRKQMAPLFKICGIHSEVIVTNRRHHVTEIINSYDLASIDGIVTVGGDGLYSECINALLHRNLVTSKTDFQKTSLCNNDIVSENPTPTSRIRSDIPVGIIPAGSGNVLVDYLHGNKDIETSILHIMKGHTARSNVAGVYRDRKPPLFSTLILGFGLCGEMVRDCEKTRCFGPSRYSVAPLNSLFKRRTINMAVEVTSAETEVERDHTEYNECVQGIHDNTYTDYIKDKIYSIDMWVPTLVNGVRSVLPVIGDNNLCLHAVRKCSLLSHLRHLCKVNSRKTHCFDFDFISSMRGTGYRVTLKGNDADEPLTRKYYINNDGDPVLLQSTYFDVRCDIVVWTDLDLNIGDTTADWIPRDQQFLVLCRLIKLLIPLPKE